MNYNEQKFYTAKVKNLLTNKTKFFDVYAPTITKAVLAAEELGSLFFCTASVECIACGLNRLGTPAVVTVRPSALREKRDQYAVEKNS